jgi:hypoxanthine phosphoribosyltransferase
MQPHPNVVLKPFIDEIDIRRRVEALARQIAADTGNEEIVVVGVLKGSFMFLADLVRLIHGQGVPLVIDFVQVSSYGSGTVSSGTLTMTHDLTTDLRDRWVLLADDILDTGRTSRFLSDHLRKKRPKILKTCVFLDKPKRRTVPFQADYVGFRVPDAFVVGYGLDYDNRYRERPGLSLVSFTDREPETSFDIEVRDGTVFLVGRLDAAGVAYSRETLMHWPGDLTCDLSGLEYLSSAGLGLLLMVHREISKTGHHLRLLNLIPKIREVFVLSGFDKVFKE